MQETYNQNNNIFGVKVQPDTTDIKSKLIQYIDSK